MKFSKGYYSPLNITSLVFLIKLINEIFWYYPTLKPNLKIAFCNYSKNFRFPDSAIINVYNELCTHDLVGMAPSSHFLLLPLPTPNKWVKMGSIFKIMKEKDATKAKKVATSQHSVLIKRNNYVQLRNQGICYLSDFCVPQKSKGSVLILLIGR